MDQGSDLLSGAPSRSRIVRRRRVVLTTVAAAALVSVGGLVGSVFVQSPSQAAADTRPPRASVITAPVTFQVLRSTLVLRGVFADGKTVQVQPTSVAATAGNPAGASMVVTGIFTSVGKQAEAGRPLLEYSGRPVFLLPGRIPAYRDLLPGETGADVVQLQKALVSLGYRIDGDTSGVLGSGTQTALTRLYSAMGYPVPITGQATATAVKAAQQQVGQARSALDAALSGATPSSSAATGGAPASGPAKTGPADSVSALREQLDQAEQALTAAEAVNGPMLPASEVVFMSSLPATVVSIPVSVGDSVKGPVLTLSQGGLQLTGMLDPTDQPLIKSGMSVQVLDESTGAQVSGTVDSLGTLVVPGDASPSAGSGSGDPAAQSQQGANGGAAYVPLAIRPSGAWNQDLAGQNVRITITAAASSGAVLAVPEAAISAQADDETSVTVQDASGALRQVPVRTGISADGLVQITPVHAKALASGDLVVVGQ